MNQENIGKFISKLRKAKKLTQEELAEKLKVSSKSISRWETGKCMPDISLLIPLSEILGVSVNELITGEYIEDKNIKEKSEQVIKETIGYSNKRLKKQKTVFIVVILFIFVSLSLIFGMVDYKRIRYGSDPLFMIRVTSGEKSVHHYIGLGYRVERKVGVSYSQPFANSEYVRFGTWFFTKEMKILKAEPDYLKIRSESQELQANRGGYCWEEEELFVCVPLINFETMVFNEILSVQKSKPVVIMNPYGKIIGVNAYKIKNIEKGNGKFVNESYLFANLEYKDNVISMPSDDGTYVIEIHLEADEGSVWHYFKVKILK